MTCFMCKGNMENSLTTYMEDLGNCIVIIKNVPCRKCTQCGEVSYSAAVVKEIEKIINAMKNNMAEIAVVNYNAKVA